MQLTVFLAVLFAAALHASWNAMLKSTADKYLSMTAIVVGAVPIALAAVWLSPPIHSAGWPYLLLSVLCHCGYQLFLLWSYQLGDFSQVYPIARGTAPLLVTAASILLLNVSFSVSELLGIVLIGSGVLSLILMKGKDGIRNPKAGLYALGTGVFIASYSLVDGLGARVANSPVAFYGWSALLNSVFFSGVMYWRQRDMFQSFSLKVCRFAVLGGSASFVAYAIVIWAFTHAPIALVSALRETSIVFALCIGAVVMGESWDKTRIIATALTVAGVIIVRLS